MFFRKKKKLKKMQLEHSVHSDLLGMICWVEIPATDVKRAVNFYKKVFKCDFDYQVFNDIGYAFFKSNNTNIKGTIAQVDKINEGVGPIIFFKVEGFMTSVLKEIPKNGGAILQEKEMIKNAVNANTNSITTNFIDGKIGYFAKFKDSEGNVFCLYSNS